METFASWTATSKTHQDAESLLYGCWMECMNNSNNNESMLWKVLEKEGLADLSQFHKPRLFDEVPLFSRLSDISFLADLDSDEASAVLLRFGLKFLKSVIAYEEHRTPYFAALTIWSFSEDDPVVPNLFVWSDSISKLYDKLTLHVATTRFGKAIKRLVSQLRLPDPFEVREDTSTAPDMSRVFIGPSLPPYQNFVPLYTFHKQARAAT
jgi:Immunity protein 15